MPDQLSLSTLFLAEGIPAALAQIRALRGAVLEYVQTVSKMSSTKGLDTDTTTKNIQSVSKSISDLDKNVTASKKGLFDYSFGMKNIGLNMREAMQGLSGWVATTKAAGSSVTETTSRFENFASQQARLRGSLFESSFGFKEITKAAKDAGLEFKNFNPAAQVESLKKFSPAINPAVVSLSNLRNKTVDLNKSYEGIVRSQTSFLTKTEAAKSSVSGTSSAITAQNKHLVEHGKQLSHITDAWDRLKAAARVTASYGIAATAIFGVVNAMKTGVVAIAQYDQAIQNLNAILGNVTIAQLSVMGDKMREVSQKSRYSVEEIGSAMQVLAQAGFTAEQSISAIQSVANLATGSLEDLRQTADLMSSTIVAFNLSAEDSSRVADVMANALNRSKATLETLRISFNYVGAAASESGLSIEQTAATLGILSNAGLRASTAATGFRQVLAKMLAPTAAMRAELEKYGKSVNEINPAMVGFETAVKNMIPLFMDHERGVLDMAKAYQVFQLRGAQAAQVIMKAFLTGNWDKFIKEMYQVGAASDMAAKQQEGLIVKFQKLIISGKNLAIAFGEEVGLVGVFKGIIDTIKGFSDALGSIASSGFGSFIIQVGLLSSAIKILIPGFKSLWSVFLTTNLAARMAVGFFLTLQTGATGAAAAIAALKAAFVITLNPITLLIVGITGLGIALYKLTNWNESHIKSLQKLSVQYNENISALNVFEEALSKTKEGSLEYISMLQRFSKDHEDLAKQIQESTGVVDISTLSFERISGVLKDIKIKNIEADLDKNSEALGRYIKQLEKLNILPTYNAEEIKQTTKDIDAVINSLALDLLALKDSGKGPDEINKKIKEMSETVYANESTWKSLMTVFGLADGAIGKIASQIENRYTKAANEAEEASKKMAAAIAEMSKTLEIVTGKTFENMTVAEKMEYASFISQADEKIKKFKETANEMGLTQEQINARMSVLYAEGLAEYVASKTKEIDTDQQTAERKIQVLEAQLQKELAAIDKAQKEFKLSPGAPTDEYFKAMMNFETQRKETANQFNEEIARQRMIQYDQIIAYERKKEDELVDYKIQGYQQQLDTMLGLLQQSVDSQSGAQIEEFNKMYAELTGTAKQAADEIKNAFSGDVWIETARELPDAYGDAYGELITMTNQLTGEIVQMYTNLAGETTQTLSQVTGKSVEALKSGWTESTEYVTEVFGESYEKIVTTVNNKTGEIVKAHYNAAGEIDKIWNERDSISKSLDKVKDNADKALDAIKVFAEKQEQELIASKERINENIEKLYGDEVKYAEAKQSALLKSETDYYSKALKLAQGTEKQKLDLVNKTVQERLKLEEKLFDLSQKQKDADFKTNEAKIEWSQKLSDIDLKRWEFQRDFEGDTEDYFKKMAEFDRQELEAKRDKEKADRDAFHDMEKTQEEQERITKEIKTKNEEEKKYRESVKSAKEEVEDLLRKLEEKTIELEFNISKNSLDQIESIKTAAQGVAGSYEVKIPVKVENQNSIDGLIAKMNALKKAALEAASARAKAEGRSSGGLIGGYMLGGLLKMALGGGVKDGRSGMQIPGYGGGDRRLILGEDGEVMIRKEQVRKFGAPFFLWLNDLSTNVDHVFGAIRKRVGGMVVPSFTSIPRIATRKIAYQTGGSLTGGLNIPDLGIVKLNIGDAEVPVIMNIDAVGQLKEHLRRKKLLRSN
jgi:TP901 family phage tail tape measure protein